MPTAVNMLLESQKYSNLSDFLRSRDNREAIAAYVIDEGHQSTFFNNFPGLMYQEYQMDKLVGDVAKIRHFNQTIGTGIVGPAKIGRQLAGNEAMSRSAYRNVQMTFGVHRYAVALENIVDKKVLPTTTVSYILQSTTKWWAMQDDIDSFMTLFRDYPFYVSETLGLTNTEVQERVLSLFGRGTINDVGALVDVIFAGNGSKTDIEPGAAVTGFRSTAAGDRVGLVDTDTLTSSFVDSLAQYIQNQLKMPATEVKGEQPFHSMIIERRDMQLLFINSASTLTLDLKNISALPKVNSQTLNEHAIFSRELGELFGIRFMTYGQIDKSLDPAQAAPKQIKEFKNSIYEDLMGKAIKPEAKVLAAAFTGESVTGLTTYEAGYLAPFGAGIGGRGVSIVPNTYQLFVSSGAKFFPYFDGMSLTYGKDSINGIDSGLYGDGILPGAISLMYLGRMQVGQGNTATTRWKVVYKGPIYTGTIQIGNNNDVVSYVEDAFKLEIVGLHRWNPGAGSFDVNTLAADWATFKAFLGIGAGNAIDPTLRSRQYQFNRRIHMFEAVRTIVFGQQLLYKVNGGGVEYNQEVRDYGAFTGSGLNVVQGKKLVESGHGLINNHALVCFKRPVATI